MPKDSPKKDKAYYDVKQSSYGVVGKPPLELSFSDHVVVVRRCCLII